MSKSPTLPIIHLNGSNPHTLFEDIYDAFRALDDAEAALQSAAPNERDYYPVDGTFKRAVAEHRERAERLQVTKWELQKILEHLETFL